MGKKQEAELVRIAGSYVNTCATIARAHLTAAVAESKRGDTLLALEEIEMVRTELDNIAAHLVDNPAKG